MAAPNVGAIPEVGGAMDFSGGDEAGLPDPSNAEMEAMLEVEDAPAGDAVAAPAEPATTTAGDPPVAATIPAPAAAAPVTPAADPEVPAELPAPGAAALTPEQLQVETKNLRKGWSALAREKEAVLEKVANANAIMARSKEFEEKARQYDALPDLIQSDPLAFLFRALGKSTPEDQEAYVNDVLLNKVIETEKSPLERQMAAMQAKLDAKEAAEVKARADGEVAAKKAENDRILVDWAARNIAFASSTPENVEKYDLINTLDQGEAVHTTCQAYFNLHKVVLDPEVAADHLEARLRAAAKKSKFLKTAFAAESPPVVPAAPAPKAQPSNGTTAPKRTGTTTLTNVASGEGAPPAAIEIPEDDDRFDAVLREMTREGTLPDEFRLRAS